MANSPRTQAYITLTLTLTLTLALTLTLPLTLTLTLALALATYLLTRPALRRLRHAAWRPDGSHWQDDQAYPRGGAVRRR